MKIVVALIIFSVIIIIHELGHFLLAKHHGVCVQEFSLGLGPTIWGFTKGETKYCINILPFGGACMMLGEDEDSDDSRALNNKSVGQRMSIVLAGPIFNFILAFFLSLFLVGYAGADPAIVGNVGEGSPAQEAGIMPGDKIIKLDNSRIFNYREIVYKMMLNKGGKPVDIVYERDGKRQEVTVKPEKAKSGNYLIGIGGAGRQEQNIFGIIKYSFLELRCQVKVVFWSLRYMVSGYFTPDDIAGPVGIVNMIGNTYEAARPEGVLVVLMSMFNISVMISANLGVMNLLPLPALDGGRFVFFVIEAIRRKKIPAEKEGMIHMAGLIVLLGLMVLIMANDIKNIFF